MMLLPGSMERNLMGSRTIVLPNLPLFLSVAIAFNSEYAQFHYESCPPIDAARYGERITKLLDNHDWEIPQTQLNLFKQSRYFSFI